MSTSPCFVSVFAALPRIPVIHKKVLMRTEQFLDSRVAFTTSACFYHYWARKRIGGGSTATSSPLCSDFRDPTASAATVGGENQSQELPCRRALKTWDLSVLEMDSLGFTQCQTVVFPPFGFNDASGRNKTEPSGSVLPQGQIVSQGDQLRLWDLLSNSA